MQTPATITLSAWPPRLSLELAAAYVGEKSVTTFLSRVGVDYPAPVVDRGRGRGRVRIWDRAELDRAIGAREGGALVDAAELL